MPGHTGTAVIITVIDGYMVDVMDDEAIVVGEVK